MENFSCPRSCPRFERSDNGVFWCRFRPILDVLGDVKVNSHTVKVKVQYKDGDALKAAVEAMGGQWLGQGSHPLYQGKVTGFGFRLEGWRFPLVLGDNGELSFDDYNGAWGKVADLDRLRTEYGIGAVQRAAVNLGWSCERTSAGLTVYHPSGGMLTVSADMQIETSGFVGSGCHEAREALGLERLGLSAGEVVNKAEFSQAQAVIQTGS